MTDLFGAYAAYILAAYGATAVGFIAMTAIVVGRLLYWAARAREAEALRNKP